MTDIVKTAIEFQLNGQLTVHERIKNDLDKFPGSARLERQLSESDGILFGLRLALAQFKNV